MSIVSHLENRSTSILLIHIMNSKPLSIRNFKEKIKDDKVFKNNNGM